MDKLTDWCRIGQTVALVGSSGVGKSTLAMSLGAPALATQGIREDDSKGRHTTTARRIHRLDAGGLLIDTPGMRELQLADCEGGVAEVFDDVVTLSESCRFGDCSHQSEPGCAVRQRSNQASLTQDALKSYFKLQSEQARNAKSLRERRHESRKQGQYFKSVLSASASDMIASRGVVRRSLADAISALRFDVSVTRTSAPSHSFWVFPFQRWNLFLSRSILAKRSICSIVL